MIEIKDINVSYKDKTIFKDSKIEIPNGKLCMISGPSGSGKTTLFYILGLISVHRNYQYSWDDKIIDISDQSIKDSLRKDKIAFIFQDKNLHEYLTIEQNLKLYAALGNKDDSITKMHQVLEEVNLNLPLDTLCEVLSGGQKQRLAIACALMKNPELIIADEPTSALDHTNRDLIIDCFQSIVKTGRMVIIATHDKNIISKADILYTINNHKIICSQEFKSNIGTFDNARSKLNKSFYKWYNQFNSGRSFLERKIILYLPAIVLLLCFICYGLIGGLRDKCYELLSENSVCEILITDRNAISETGYNLLSELEEVVNIYPVTELYIDSLMIDGVTYQFDSYLIPYYPEQISLLGCNQYDENTVYLSSVFNLNGNSININNIEYSIGGIIEDDITLIQSNRKQAIYIPYENFEISETTEVILEIKDFMYMEGLSKKIHKINNNYDITVSNSDYLSQKELLDAYEGILNKFMIVVVVISVVMLTVIRFFHLSSIKYDIAVLKSNGLSKNETITLLIDETARQLHKKLTIDFLLGLVVYSICLINNIGFNINEGIRIYVILLLVSESIPFFIITIYLIKIDPERIIRF